MVSITTITLRKGHLALVSGTGNVQAQQSIDNWKATLLKDRLAVSFHCFHACTIHLDSTWQHRAARSVCKTTNSFRVIRGLQSVEPGIVAQAEILC